MSEMCQARGGAKRSAQNESRSVEHGEGRQVRRRPSDYPRTRGQPFQQMMVPIRAAFTGRGRAGSRTHRRPRLPFASRGAAAALRGPVSAPRGPSCLCELRVQERDQLGPPDARGQVRDAPPTSVVSPMPSSVRPNCSLPLRMAPSVGKGGIAPTGSPRPLGSIDPTASFWSGGYSELGGADVNGASRRA